LLVKEDLKIHCIIYIKEYHKKENKECQNMFTSLKREIKL
jgi:hypothetical protein